MFMADTIYELQHKAELQQCVATLNRMGFKLYGSFGTADYYTEHGIPVKKIILL